MFYDPLFDLDKDGKIDVFEAALMHDVISDPENSASEEDDPEEEGSDSEDTEDQDDDEDDEDDEDPEDEEY
ncbi:MAG: hypothetical protein K5637_02630 [Lachnospiraceae bacterium]|nr:hypothetical protein [Lachnospiraceae bacterium]